MCFYCVTVNEALTMSVVQETQVEIEQNLYTPLKWRQKSKHSLKINLVK
jgi:hypothetical protein